MIDYKNAKTEKELSDIELMAAIIWPKTYKDILSTEQIAYMLKMFLSVDAMKQNIGNGYTYQIIYEDNNKVGFVAYEILKDKVFLSKLYLLPDAQNKHIATKVIEFLKQFSLPIELTVNKYNTNAYQKYLHLGFKVTDSVQTSIGSSYIMDDYVMVFAQK